MKNRNQNYIFLTKMRLFCLIVAGSFAFGFASFQTVEAQTPTASPAPAASPTPTRPRIAQEFTFAAAMRRFAENAARMIPTFTNEFERPFSNYLIVLAWLVAIFLFWLYFAQLLKKQEGADKEFFLWLCSAVFIFALLAYAGDANGDGKAGDIVDYMRGLGNNLAFGTGNAGNANSVDATGSYVSGKVQEARQSFDRAYNDFVTGAFTVKVNGQDMPVTPPGVGLEERIFASYSDGFNPQKVKEGLNPEGWKMSDLFEWLNVSRGILEIADLFLLVLLGVLGAALRLMFPLAIAVAIHRDLRSKVTTSFLWSAGVICLVLPLFTQILRFGIFLAGNLAFRAANPGRDYYQFDATTVSVIAQGSPVYMIFLMCFVMCIGALVMFASPFLVFRVATGQLVEGLVSTISGWFSGLASVAIGYVTSQLSTAYAQQAEVVQAEGALKSALTQATFGRQAAYASAEGQKLASGYTAQAGLDSSYIAAGANLEAVQINADASRSAAYLGAAGQLENSLYGIGANQLGTVGNAAISAYKDLSNLSLAERQEVMRQGIEYWAAQGDANAKFWQEAIRQHAEILDSGAQNFGQGVRSIPFLNSLFGIVANPEDLHRSLNSMAGLADDPNKSMVLPGDGGNVFPRADGRLIELPKEILETPFGKTLQESLGKGFGLPPLPPSFVQPKLDAQPLPGGVAAQLPLPGLGNVGGLTKEQQRAFGNMTQLFRREPNFLPTLTAMAQSRGINPDQLLNLMALETAGTFNRGIHNGKGYVGLIQFGEAARQDVGLPRDWQSAQQLLNRISATQQLPYVFSYLDQKAKNFGTPLDTQAKLYAAVGAGGVAKSDAAVMFRDGGFRTGDFYGTRKISNAGFDSNPSWNVNKDGVIQQWEFGASAYNALGAGQKFSVLSGVGRTTQNYGAAVSSFGGNLNNSSTIKNNPSGITTYQAPVIPDGQNYLNQLNRMNYITAKTAAPQMANEMALRSNLAIAKGKFEMSSQATREFYTGSRSTVEQSFQAQTNLAGDVANLSKQGAYAAYVGQTKSADAVYHGQNQAAQIGYYGQTQSAQRTFAGQNQASEATYAAQTKSADLQFAGQREAALIQQQTALQAVRLRAMSQLIQSVGNTAGHQFAEAFEKFNRF